MSHLSTTPETLEAALLRINYLEEQLALAHRLFHQHSVGHQNLSDYLSQESFGSSNEASPSPPYRSGSSHALSSEEEEQGLSSRVFHPTTDSHSRKGKDKGVETLPLTPSLTGRKGEGATGKSTPVDIGAFVLRALSLRKNLTIGAVDPLEAETEFENIVKGSGLNPKQVAQVREWSGLQ